MHIDAFLDIDIYVHIHMGMHVYREITYQGRAAGAAKLAARPDTVRKDLDLEAPFRLG